MDSRKLDLPGDFWGRQLKIDSKTLISSIEEWFHSKSDPTAENLSDIPIPAEIFSSDQMERHGITLALSHELTKQYAPDMLLNRLSQSESIIIKSCASLTKEASLNEGYSPAREWLLDNFYLIQQQINTIRRYLPKDYGRTLPKLANHVPGYPRIYDIALETIQHGDGRWDEDNLSRFIAAYQNVTPLTLGELWAIPITLGVALIENLSNASKRVVTDRNDRSHASLWADRMIEAAVSAPKTLVIVIADMVRSEPQMRSAFVVELARRLQSAALTLPLSWIEQHLADEELSIEQLVHEENKHQAATQVTISNSIGGLRHLGEVDWRDFVEKLSVVEKTLRLDPTATYSKMDFGTRDTYRHIVERLSRRCLLSEADVAACAIKLAKTKADSFNVEELSNPNITRYCHVGYYLVGEGLSQLENTLKIRPSFTKRIFNFIKSPLIAYLGSILLITGCLTYGLLTKAYQNGISSSWLILLGILIVISGSQLAVALVNLFATLIVKPKPLPRMDFSKGIPISFSTLVAVPAMIGTKANVESLIEALEIRFLGNRDSNLYFALLSDFNDAPTEHMPEDEALLALAQERIEALNKEYSQNNNDIFFLFHRPRLWNASEQVWMGKERKRGKLGELNNFLCEKNQSGFSLIVGNTERLSNIKYVITLDIDTQLPRESARQFVGTMAHPLNRPLLDSQKQIVIDGYGILQPRIAESFHGPNISRYVKLFGSEFGIDPYTRAVSDVYQDVFKEGSFIGKGIYDVGMFQQVLANRFPDNRILSHDLLEGCYLRSGFLSDVPLYERSPNNYLADAKRRTRWCRGDWQLIGWLLPSIKNPLSALSKFKLFDNLRRSLVPIALVLLIALDWTILHSHILWSSVILSIVILPVVANSFIELIRKPKNVLPNHHLINIASSLGRRIGQLILYLACLPHEAWYNFVAIVRTCWRVVVSKRHLLEWTPSDQVDQRLRDTPSAWLTNMWIGPVLSLAAVFTLFINHRFEFLIFSTPLLALWLTSPFIARWLSRPLKRKEPKLPITQSRFLRHISRKTWAFFENFITIENHWLPPDNYQETPVEVLARRTSPTNIGLSLLADLTAYDFGYINIRQLLSRTSNALQTISKLERYRGHLYNWYNTETLAPLLPRYISTVDSGNLAAHLLTLRQGLLKLKNDPLLNIRYLDGLDDTCDILEKTLITPLPFAIQHFRQMIINARTSFRNWSTAFKSVQELYASAEQLSKLLEQADSPDEIEWMNKLLIQTRALYDEIKLFYNIPSITPESTLQSIANELSIDFNLNETLHQVIQEVKNRLLIIDTLALQAFSFAQMDISFLYDEASHLMTIGFNVDEQRQDRSNYDLLASEARLGSFVSIAQGQALQESWFALGRMLVMNAGEPVLVSWSGSMFEYLMPLLVMPNYPGTLLDQTYQTAVRQQIAYGKQRSVPWGVSESGFNARDTQFNYLYRAFGVPGLGLKRGLEEDLVIAPYASAMALMVSPIAACNNLQLLADENFLGKYGFYEAIDYTPSRLPRDSKRVLIRSFMAHHQGMSFLAISYLLHQQPMQRRFIADPLFQATLLLLQERIPKPSGSYLQIPKSPRGSAISKTSEASSRIFNTPNTRTPQVHLLSNGRYNLVLTQAGGGYSRWKDIALTRWREDTTCDNWGLFSYICDVGTGEFFSTSYQPTVGTTEHFKTVFSQAHVEFYRRAISINVHTEIGVSPEDDIELRRFRIHNRSKIRRIIEFTSYGEVVLAPQGADLAQPAFSNLFVETEILAEKRAIIATRRPQAENEVSPWLYHLLNIHGNQDFTMSFETDRANFVGRCQTLAAPLAMKKSGSLSNTQGAVLDPIVAIRCRLTLEADASVIVDLLTGIADTRDHCVAMVDKYQDRPLANRIFGLAWTYGQVLLHQLNISETDAQLYGRLAGAIIYSSSTRRADPRILMSNRRGQSGLWGYSISGDLPIILCRIEDEANIELVRQLIQAQLYWRHKGLAVDLVILNDEQTSYRQTLQDQIMSMISAASTSDQGGKIIARIAEQVPPEDAVLLQSVARIILSDKRGTLKEQLSLRRFNPPLPPILHVNKVTRQKGGQKLSPLPNDLQFFNEYGGFTKTGDEYIIRLSEQYPTPAPWVNILANPNFGTMVSESGQGYTWSENAHEFRLTPWENDPIQDLSGESFYLRDEETGLVWSPTPLPTPGTGDYQTRHGFGYSVFEHMEDGIYSELWVYVALDASVKFAVLKIRNDSLRDRKLSATGYVSWVLGDLPSKNAMYVVTEIAEKGALLAQNNYNTEFSDRTAFFNATTKHISLIERTVTADRSEFIGRNGSAPKTSCTDT